MFKQKKERRPRKRSIFIVYAISIYPFVRIWLCNTYNFISQKSRI